MVSIPPYVIHTFIGPKFKWGPVVQDAICIEMGISNACIVISKTPSSKQMNSMWVIVVAEAHRFIRHIIFSNSLKARLLLTQFLNSIVADQIICLHFSDLKIKISTELHT